jgi:diguanylate cyclase (GGDEF)-like protein
MDTTTLVLANGLLFALYAGVMLVNARIVGGTRGAMWFAGANLLRGTSMLLVGVQWLQLAPPRYTGAVSAMLAVVGTLMLHQAFAELLERGAMLRGVQYGLVAAMTAGAIALLLVPGLAPFLGVVLCGTMSIQFAVIALLVFRFSSEEVGPAGWLTSLALAAYSLVFVLRAIMASPSGVTLLGTPPWVMSLWLMTCLVTSAAVAFGFMSLSTARLRVELLWRAQVDELTGLLNRWALKRLAMREIERCKRSKCSMAVVMIDLDGLKLVNDTTGHSCGDVVLQAVAGVLQETVREQDSVARMGGDEFCVLLPETSLDEAIRVAERMRGEVDDLVVKYRGETVRTRASLGVASSEICGLAWQSLMDHSDSALYRAKREGKNRVVVAKIDDRPGLVANEKVSRFMAERAPASVRERDIGTA